MMAFFCSRTVLQLGSQCLPVQQITHPDASPACLVDVGGSDAPAGGADGAGAAGFLFQRVQQNVIGHDDVGSLTDMQLAGVDPTPAQHIHLIGQHVGVDNHAVADDAVNLGPADAGRDQVELEDTLVVDHGVASVVATGKTHDAVHLAGKVVDYLPLALVAPLSSDNGVCRHPKTAFSTKTK